MNKTTFNKTEKNCSLCLEEVDIFALGKCDHPVCYQCSTKMRVLRGQKYCAVCREELHEVVFVEKPEPFSCLPYQQFHCEKWHNIYFSNERIYSHYRTLLLSQCLVCSEPKVFSKFEDLQQHMRKQHKLFSCTLCTMHLKVFSHEQKWYGRKELAHHRVYGDPSQGGHPLCMFCDERHLDNDELRKHLGRDHFYCRFCDPDGSHEFYSDYQNLTQHFRDSHYLCEEGSCASQQLTNAYQTDIDLKIHKFAAHSNSRAEARQNRQMDRIFNFSSRIHDGLVATEGQSLGGESHEVILKNRREDRDRAVVAAIRASMAVPGQEKTAALERSAPKHGQEEKTERTHPRNGTEQVKPPVRTMKSPDPDQDDLRALGPTAGTSIVKPAPMEVLNEHHFPSLSCAAVASTTTPACSAKPKKKPPVQEQDSPTPALNTRPLTTAPCNSAWSKIAAGVKPPTNVSQISATTKPPPGFGIEYFKPDDFNQRSKELILSIRQYLDNDESKFNEFKYFSQQFRQGVIVAAQYHRCCKDLLTDNFNRIFNELLVLLPDTDKQQALLTAHKHSKATEKHLGTGGGKKITNKKNPSETPTNVANAAAEMDCQVCPTCRQVLAPKDFNSHKTLHATVN